MKHLVMMQNHYSCVYREGTKGKKKIKKTFKNLSVLNQSPALKHQEWRRNAVKWRVIHCQIAEKQYDSHTNYTGYSGLNNVHPHSQSPSLPLGAHVLHDDTNSMYAREPAKRTKTK